MRRMTLLWLMLAAVCGGVLFHTSQQVNDGRTKLTSINDDIRKEDETIRVLQAEWSYLNQPDRLEKLAKQYLTLAPLKGRQFAKLADIADQPAPVETPAVAAAEPAPVTEAAEKPVMVAPTPAPAVAEAPAKPAPVKTAAKAQVIKIRKPAAAPVKHAAPPVATAERASSRSFGDVIKSLGVR